MRECESNATLLRCAVEPPMQTHMPYTMGFYKCKSSYTNMTNGMQQPSRCMSNAHLHHNENNFNLRCPSGAQQMSKHYHIAATTNTSLVIDFPTLLEQFRAQGLNQTSPTRPGNLKNQQIACRKSLCSNTFWFPPNVC